MENQVLALEFKSCKEDPNYFISKYIKVVHPVRGLVPFKLYGFQKKILQDLQSHRFNILRKFRQAGCTTIAAAYALWFAIFNKHKSVIILSKGDAESTEVLDRIKIMYDELPSFLKPGIIEDNKHTLKLSTNSTIKSRPSGKQSGRSLAGSLLIIDEAAFIENIDTIWAAVYPIISTGGRAFVLSTVNGVGNWYYDVYSKATSKENSFNAMDIKWQDHPEYKRHLGYEWLYSEMEEKGLNVDDWEKTTRANMPMRQWMQEYEGVFLGTGETYINGEILSRINSQTSQQYIQKYGDKMRVWQDPLPYYTYILGCDVSLGGNRDYSAFHIINAYNGQQVAEFYSNNTPINEFAQIINEEASIYNMAYVIPERNTIGNNLIDWLFNVYEYENLWADERGKFGYQLTSQNREQLLATLEESLRTETIKINSSRTSDELLTFIVNEHGKAKAEKTKNDDLVMSLALTVFAYKNLLESFPQDYFKTTDANQQKMPMPTKSIKQGLTEEEYKWLMK
jgi:hypothetical protein